MTEIDSTFVNYHVKRSMCDFSYHAVFSFRTILRARSEPESRLKHSFMKVL